MCGRCTKAAALPQHSKRRLTQLPEGQPTEAKHMVLHNIVQRPYGEQGRPALRWPNSLALDWLGAALACPAGNWGNWGNRG